MLRIKKTLRAGLKGPSSFDAPLGDLQYPRRGCAAGFWNPLPLGRVVKRKKKEKGNHSIQIYVSQVRQGVLWINGPAFREDRRGKVAQHVWTEAGAGRGSARGLCGQF